jgi:hypothetical protein
MTTSAITATGIRKSNGDNLVVNLADRLFTQVPPAAE